jgi:hypothetical protein
MPDEDKLHRKVRKQINHTLKRLGMEDWNVELAFDLDTEKTEFAEVIPVYNTKCYRMIIYNLKDLEDTLIHELLHCKMAGLVDAYDDALEKYHMAVKSLIESQEETLVNDLAKRLRE